MSQQTTTERPGPEQPLHSSVRQPHTTLQTVASEASNFQWRKRRNCTAGNGKLQCRKQKLHCSFLSQTTQKLQITPANGVFEMKTAMQEKKHCSECILNTFAQASRTRFQHARRTTGTEQQHWRGPAANTRPGQSPNPDRALPSQAQNNLESQKCSIL